MSKENNLKKVTTNMPAFKKVPTCKSMLLILCNKHGLSISANCSRKIRIGDTANQLAAFARAYRDILHACRAAGNGERW